MNWKENCRKRKSNGETQREAENWAISCKLQGRMTNGIFSSSVSVPYFGISNFHCLFFVLFFFGVYNPPGQLYGHDIWRCNHIAIGKKYNRAINSKCLRVFLLDRAYLHKHVTLQWVRDLFMPWLVPLFLNKLNCFPSLLLWCCWSNLTWNILVVCEKISVCV